MNRSRISALTLLLLVVMITCDAGSQEGGAFQGTLTYSAKQPSQHPSSLLLEAPSGVTYRLLLVPDFDVRKHVVVLDLVLKKPEQANNTNLLDPTGKLHGYQPYVFPASDFVVGARKSTYGESRVIKLQKLGMEIHVKIVDVHVQPTPGGPRWRLGYQFDDLTLKIKAQRLARESSNQSVQ